MFRFESEFGGKTSDEVTVADHMGSYSQDPESSSESDICEIRDEYELEEDETEFDEDEAHVEISGQSPAPAES